MSPKKKSKYQSQCAHCSYVAHSVIGLAKHVKSYHDDVFVVKDELAAAIDIQSTDPSEDARSDSDADTCIRPDPEPEGDPAMWEEWDADNVTLNYARDVDDSTLWDHQMGTCDDIDVEHFRNLYHNSVSDSEMEDPVAASQKITSEVKAETISITNENVMGNISSIATDLAITHSKLKLEDATCAAKSQPIDNDHQTIENSHITESRNVLDVLVDHPYSSQPCSSFSNSLNKESRSEPLLSESGNTYTLSFPLQVSDSSGGDTNTKVSQNKGKVFFCAHCDFKCDILSIVQQHTMSTHSETCIQDSAGTTWEHAFICESESMDNGQSSWIVASDECEQVVENAFVEQVPIEVTPIPDVGDEFFYSCTVNNCNRFFSRRLDFTRHVRDTHKEDGGEIFYCAFCRFAATECASVQEHSSSTHVARYLPNIQSEQSRLQALNEDNIHSKKEVAPVEKNDPAQDPQCAKPVLNSIKEEPHKLNTTSRTHWHSILKGVNLLDNQKSDESSTTAGAVLPTETDTFHELSIYKCSVNSCSQQYSKREDFCYHVKFDHCLEDGKVFYCAYCRYAATDIKQVRDHASEVHMCGKNGPDLDGLSPLQKRLTFRRSRVKIPKPFSCLFCKFTSVESHVLVYHTYREHHGPWMQQLEKVHQGFTKIADALGILQALPLLKKSSPTSKVSKKQSNSPLPLFPSVMQTRHRNISYACLAKACTGCKLCYRFEQSTMAAPVQQNMDKNTAQIMEERPALIGEQNTVGKSTQKLKKLPDEEMPPLVTPKKRTLVAYPSHFIRSTSEGVESKDQPLEIKTEQIVCTVASTPHSFKEKRSPSFSELGKSLKKLSKLLKPLKPKRDSCAQLNAVGIPATASVTSRITSNNASQQSPDAIQSLQIAKKNVVSMPLANQPLNTIVSTTTLSQPSSSQPLTSSFVKCTIPCQHSCEEHQILLLKSNDSSLTKLLLLHKSNGKVTHAEPLPVNNSSNTQKPIVNVPKTINQMHPLTKSTPTTLVLSPSSTQIPLAVNRCSILRFLQPVHQAQDSLPDLPVMSATTPEQDGQVQSFTPKQRQDNVSPSPHNQPPVPVVLGPWQMPAPHIVGNSKCDELFPLSGSKGIVLPTVVCVLDSPIQSTNQSINPIQPQASPTPSAVQIQDSAVSSTVMKSTIKKELSNEVVLIKDEPGDEVIDFADALLEDTVEDNAYLYAEENDLHHGCTETLATPFRRLLQDWEFKELKPTISVKHAVQDEKNTNKRQRDSAEDCTPSKRATISKPVRTKITSPSLQPTRVSTRKPKPNVKCLCEDCCFSRIMHQLRPYEVLNEELSTEDDVISLLQEENEEILPPKCLLDPKLEMRPVIVLPNIMSILGR